MRLSFHWLGKQIPSSKTWQCWISLFVAEGTGSKYRNNLTLTVLLWESWIQTKDNPEWRNMVSEEMTKKTQIYSYDSTQLHLLVQSSQWKLQYNVWNMFKVNNKDIRMRIFWDLNSLTLNRFNTLFLLFHCWLWTSKLQLGIME